VCHTGCCIYSDSRNSLCRRLDLWPTSFDQYICSERATGGGGGKQLVVVGSTSPVGGGFSSKETRIYCYERFRTAYIDSQEVTLAGAKLDSPIRAFQPMFFDVIDSEIGTVEMFYTKTTEAPSSVPSRSPSSYPSFIPTATPSDLPTFRPSKNP
jgi:hypothetical protein